MCWQKFLKQLIKKENADTKHLDALIIAPSRDNGREDDAKSCSLTYRHRRRRARSEVGLVCSMKRVAGAITDDVRVQITTYNRGEESREYPALYARTTDF